MEHESDLKNVHEQAQLEIDSLHHEKKDLNNTVVNLRREIDFLHANSVRTSLIVATKLDSGNNLRMTIQLEICSTPMLMIVLMMISIRC